MERRALSDRAPEAGFLLVEAVIAVALIAICAGAALTATAAVTHATAHALSESALTATAQNILTDLRAATAYNSVELAAIAGHATSFDAVEPGPDGIARPVHVVVSVARSTTADAFIGTVTVRTAGAAAVQVQATLVGEAPAPGAVLPSSTPPPASAAGAAGSAALDQIPL